MVNINVKWNKQVFEKICIDPLTKGLDLKEKLYQLTGVPVERQKVMAKGLWKGTLKDDLDLSGLGWKDGMLLAMMGTSTGIPKPPEEETVFVEDMSAMEKQKVGDVDPPGLDNLGNTCYMNATLQCLKAVPELRDSLEASPLSASSGDVADKMVIALRDLFKQMDRTTDSVTPHTYVETMRLTFPQFAQTSQKGGYAQQDADEYFNELLNVLSQKLTKPGPDFSFANKSDAISALFGIELSTELKCLESEDEPVVKGSDTQRRLQCNITSDVVTLEQGLKLGFESEIEKNSSLLGRNALWKQTRKIHKLPKYMAVQLNRFFWKRTPNSRDHQGVNCKILKPVKFSFTFDIFDFCDDELKAVLKGPRDEHAKEMMAKGKSSSKDEAVDMEEDDELQAALKLSLGEGGSAGIGIPANFRGTYELFGVVTHKGRASDSGHYMGWVKQKGENWICFDDETASRCKEDDVGQLSGGGDYDMGYLLMYRAKE